MLTVAALYHFTRFPDPAALKPGLLEVCMAHGVKGSLLLAPEGTVETVRDIEATFGASPFSGEDKVERIGALAAAALDDATLAALVA